MSRLAQMPICLFALALSLAFAGGAGAAQLPVQKPTRDTPTPRVQPAPCKSHEVWVFKTVCTPRVGQAPLCRRGGHLEKICN
jgi:hypothetical protein